ncbi:MAG: hypothetical protein NT031_18270 [Planctomycetota bacterium]|nr:hypothetical protein [Planctomycetota bacterium]
MDILAIYNSPETIAAKTAAVREEAIKESERLRQGGFAGIRAEDLELVFALYDREFFGGWLAERARIETGQDVRLAVPGRMTRAGGRMMHRWRRGPGGGKKYWYEIVIAGGLLGRSFAVDPRPVKVCGLTCPDAMAALPRLMAHEIVHLAEFLAWGESRCGGRRFKVIASRLANRRRSSTRCPWASRIVSTSRAERSPGGSIAFSAARRCWSRMGAGRDTPTASDIGSTPCR